MYEERPGPRRRCLTRRSARRAACRTQASYHCVHPPTPKTLPGIPALLDRAASERWATVTVHCPLHTGRAQGGWPPGTDLLALLEPVFEHFLQLPEHWVVETTIPWARYHRTVRALSKRVEVVHEGCGGARCRLAIGASGWITPCICSDRPEFRMGNVRKDDLAACSAMPRSPI